MPLRRSIILAAMPQNWRIAAEADSKTWITDCSACGHRSNVWELGGIRWQAAGTFDRISLHWLWKIPDATHSQTVTLVPAARQCHPKFIAFKAELQEFAAYRLH